MNTRSWPAFRAYIVCVAGTMPGRVTLVLAVTAAQALAEGLAIVLLVPLLSIVGLETGQGAVSTLALRIRAGFEAVGVAPTLGAILPVYVAVVALQSLVAQWQMVSVLALEHRFVARLRQRLYAAITRANWRYLSTTRAPELAHVLTQELERVGTAAYQVLTLVSNAMIAVLYFAIAIRLAPGMTLIVSLSGAAVLMALRHRIATARTGGEHVSRTRGHLFATAVEHVSALRTAKSYGVEPQHVERFSQAANAAALAHMTAIGHHASSRSRFEIGAVIALALMLYAGLGLMGLPPATVLILMYVFARMMPRLSTIQQSSVNIAHYMGSFEAVMSLQTRLDAEAEPAPLDKTELAFDDHVRVDHVSFAYSETEENALDDVTLDIAFGTVTAIVGPSGSGKSTLADLLTGLQRPQHGQLLVDGMALAPPALAAWKRQIGYVHQDTFLFHETVTANLRWANPEATDADVHHALQLAAAEFVLELPDGLQTILGDRGIRLSGGERQRLALARALLRKPRLLVLDEATSALDSDNENRILASIDRLRGSLTVVLITHRLSAVRQADIIHVLDKGRIVESGDWQTLSRLPTGRFRALCEAQGIAALLPVSAVRTA